MAKYKTKGTCSSEINYEVDENGILTSVKFTGGCRGNLQGLCKLATGRHIDELITALRGIECRGTTSCPDQLANALSEYKQNK